MNRRNKIRPDQPRVNKRGLETRSKLLLTGIEQFHSNGFNGIGIECIIKESGTRKSFLFNLFKSKGAFAAAVID